MRDDRDEAKAALRERRQSKQQASMQAVGSGLTVSESIISRIVYWLMNR